MTKLRMKVNRTVKYLWPSVTLFGRTFLKELSNLTNIPGYPTTQSILFTGIGDVLYYRAKGFDVKDLIFIVVDTRGCYNVDKNVYIDINKGKESFKNFLKYIRTNKHYQDDYWYNNHLHCIVLNMEGYENIYWNFFLSKYSQMYKEEVLKQIGITPFRNLRGKKEPNPVHAVLTKNHELGVIQLKTKIYESFGTDDIPDEPKEYDIPWFIQDEFLNYDYATEQELNTIKQVKYGFGNRNPT